MSDLISRKEAITQAHEIIKGYAGYKAWAIVDMLRKLPSAQPEQECEKCIFKPFKQFQPEPKKGKWIPQNMNKSYGKISTAVYYYPKCSVCGWSADYTNYCPNCGAKMEDEE